MEVVQYCVGHETLRSTAWTHVEPKCLKRMKLHTDPQDFTNGVILFFFSQSSVSVVIPDWSYLLYLINQSLTSYFISLVLMSCNNPCADKVTLESACNKPEVTKVKVCCRLLHSKIFIFFKGGTYVAVISGKIKRDGTTIKGELNVCS